VPDVYETASARLAAELAQLRPYFEWPDDVPIRILHVGENITLQADTPDGAIILRRYRPGRHDPATIAAELAWLAALAPYLPVPAPLHGSAAIALAEGAVYAAFRRIAVQPGPPEQDGVWRTLGRTLWRLHTAADAVLADALPDWTGHHRPHYAAASVIEPALTALTASGLLPAALVRRCEQMAQRLTIACLHADPTPKRFVHADLHDGNLLWDGRQWVCIDFDDCGFGDAAWDLGVLRLHLRARDRLDLWPEVLAGYGPAPSAAAIALGTALRIWHMAGKIPLRQDLPALRLEPDRRIDRYLGYITLELDGAGL
jgi:Ser/Thr protein kinase RdoA (MazF antagonist)